MTHLGARNRDEFLKALEEARRAAMADSEAPHAARKETAASPRGSAEFRCAIDRLAVRLRSYVSVGLLARLYADNAARSTRKQPAPTPNSAHIRA